MKLELSFSCVTDLTNQLQDLLEDLKGNDVHRAAIIKGVAESIYGDLSSVAPPMIENPVVAQQAAFDAKQEVEAPKKRTRRTKAEIEAEKNQPVVPEVAPVAEQPVLPTLTSAPVVTLEPVVETAPKNFYSLSEFVGNFVIILNNLLNDGSLGIGDIEAACKYYDVKLIYMIGKELSMCEHFYNDLVTRQIITKKGDY